MPEDSELLHVFESLYRKLTGTQRDVRVEDRLREDLSLDSLLAVELLVWLEDACDVALLEDPRIFDITTVDELLALIGSCGITIPVVTS